MDVSGIRNGRVLQTLDREKRIKSGCDYVTAVSKTRNKLHFCPFSSLSPKNQGIN